MILDPRLRRSHQTGPHPGNWPLLILLMTTSVMIIYDINYTDF